nr:hypothetical protein [Tanacetum cinerariifolium]
MTTQPSQTVRNTNPHMSTSTRVNHKTNVSRPHHKSNQLKDKVLPNNSQVKPKKTQVEEHPRISSISNKTKSVTACNDSLNSRTSNVNAVCATCKKCLVDSDHLACVTKMLNDVNAKTKKPNIIQLILFIVDFGCMMHMTGNQKLLCNFVKKFLGTVYFGNDQFAPILGYGDLVQGNITINKVYYVKGLNHNLFSVGQFCDADLEVASINRKKYILVIVEDYSRYTWTLFLCSKDETPEVLKEFLTMIQRNLQALVITVRTDRGTEFLNKTLNAFFKEEGIEHQTSTARTPEQNGVVKRRNRTLVEAARTMLLASKLPLFFWAEAIATACYTQNRSIIMPNHDKTAYHIINDRKPLIKHLHIFGCICYLTRDGENLDKMKEKGDLCILVGYSTQSKGYRVYNKSTRMIVESTHIRFDEFKEVSETSVANDTSGLVPQRKKALYYDNSDPVPQLYNVSSLADAHVPSQQELNLLFAPSTPTYVHAEENNDNQAEEEHLPDDEFTNPFCALTKEVAKSFLHNIGNSNVPTFNQPQVSEYRWTKDHPLEQVRRNPSRPVQTRRQLATDPEMCMFALTVWELVDKPFGKSVIRLKWLWKKKDEDQTVIRNKARLVEKSTRVFSNLSDKTAFLNGPLKEEVYVAQPDGFVDPDHPEKVYLLRKALYGLKQALRAWYDELSKFMTSKGFTKGLQIHQSPRGIFINQANHALEILHKHGMEKGQSIGTPMATKPKLDADLSGNPVDQTDYRSKLEAEYVALSARCAQVMWMRTQLQDYGLHYNKIPLYCDSQSAIAISCNPVQHSRTKHIHTRYHFIKEQVENNIIELYFVRTEYQLADMFTKALPEDRFKYLVRQIGMRCLTPTELEVLAKESA